jgi:hypothetical protein
VPRSRDDEYYVDDRTEHVAQGDIFGDLPFAYFVPDESSFRQEGKRRPPEEPPAFTGHGMLINYTSGFMAQPPGTRGYAHPFRLVAPIFPFELLLELGVAEVELEKVRRDDNLASYMYLPPYTGEFSESAVLPYRPVLIHHDLLEGRRITQLQEGVAVRLQQKVATTFLGGKWAAEDLTPDLSDHWNA